MSPVLSDGLPLSGQPYARDEPVFREPWEAEAFAMVVALQERGLFTWPEWAAHLAAEIAAAPGRGDADLGDTYFAHWLATLEGLVVDRVADASGDLTRYRDAWSRACARTPHGRPITLEARDFDA